MEKNDLPPEVAQHLKREYWCFISYRHADNKEPGRQWATWLHQALETYEVPADLVGTKNEHGDLIPDRIFPVFRDEEELPADAELTKPIEAALQRSRFLVVLCSPQAEASKFVGDEILRFKQLGKQDRILAAIIEGEPNASDDPTKGGIGRECFPRPLRYAVDAQGHLTAERTEPIAPDFRLPDGTPGWTISAAYRQALESEKLPPRQIKERVDAYAKQTHLMLLKVVAGVLGVPLGVLTQRDKAYQLAKARRRAKILYSVVIGFAVLTALACVGGIVAWQQKQKADSNASLAQKNEKAAQEQKHQADLNANLARENEKAAKEQEQKVRAQLKEAARTDWITAKDLLAKGRSRDAFAYLARSCEYDPESSLAAETAVLALNTWSFHQLPQTTLEGHEDKVTSAEFSNDGLRILTTSEDKTARVWEAHTGNLLATLKGHVDKVTSAKFSPDGSRVVTGSPDNDARVWEMFTGKLMAVLHGHRSSVYGVEFSPDGQRILTDSADDTARVWETATGRLLFTLHEEEHGLTSAQFSPDGQRILTNSQDKTARVWEAVSGKLLSTLHGEEHGLRAAQFSPDGRLILSISEENTTHVWEAHTGNLLATLQGHDSKVTSAEFSNDGQRILTTSEDNTARVWESGSGNLLVTLNGQEDG
ncbi:MAG: TIR domain-containing protein, partial [Roseimicrobium sp.]